MSEETPLPPTRNSRPGALNAILLCLSVAVILGIYGYSIFRTTTQDDDLVLAPVRPAPVESIEPDAAAPEDPAPEEVDEPEITPTDELADQEIPEAPAIEPIEPTEEDLALVDQATDEPTSEETEVSPPVIVAIDDEMPDEIEDAPPVALVVEDPMPADETPDAPVIEEIDEEVVVFDEEQFLEEGWKVEASEVLRGFMAATSLEERAAFVMDQDRVSPRLRALERQETAPWQGLSADDFNHIDLSEADRRKGIFLMLREVPGDDLSGDSIRNYAFFKRTDDGLKLDLEVFAQTTGQTFQAFIERPQPGVSRIFRVFIAEDPAPPDASERNYRSYFVAGLSDFSAATRIRTTTESPVGRILAAADFTSEDGARRIMRNATVELRWTDQPENPAIELSKFICWEFLGLGGEPVGE